MIKSVFILFTLFFILHAENVVSVKNLTGDFLFKIAKENLPIGFSTSDSEIKNKINKDITLTKMYLNGMSEEEQNNLKYFILTNISLKMKKKILDKARKTITDDMAKSYYIVNKKRFYTDRIVDIYLYRFKAKEDVEKIKNIEDLPGKGKKSIYPNIVYGKMMPNYLLQADSLKPKQLSKINKINDEYVLFYYVVQRERGLTPYANAKIAIKETLLQKRAPFIIDETIKSQESKQ